MKYENIPCAACGVPFGDRDGVVVCPVCGAPRHRTCWTAAGGCAHAAAHAQGYVWTSPVPEAKPAGRTEPDEPTAENGERRIPCPSCGQDNFENDVYCVRCGALLDGSDGRGYADDWENADRAARSARRAEVMRQYERFGGLDPNSLLDGIPVCEYADYVGGARPGRLLRRISGAERIRSFVTSILPAGVFGPVWFLYRKMVKEGLLLALVMLALAACSGLCQLNDAFVAYAKGAIETAQDLRAGRLTPQESTERLYELAETYDSTVLPRKDQIKETIGSCLYYLAFLGAPLYGALRGLALYRKKAKNAILGIRARCTNLDEYRDALIAEGGGSAGLAVAGVVLVLLARGAAVYLPFILALFR